MSPDLANLQELLGAKLAKASKSGQADKQKDNALSFSSLQQLTALAVRNRTKLAEHTVAEKIADIIGNDSHSDSDIFRNFEVGHAVLRQQIVGAEVLLREAIGVQVFQTLYCQKPRVLNGYSPRF